MAERWQLSSRAPDSELESGHGLEKQSPGTGGGGEAALEVRQRGSKTNLSQAGGLITTPRETERERESEDCSLVRSLNTALTWPALGRLGGEEIHPGKIKSSNSAARMEL